MGSNPARGEIFTASVGFGAQLIGPIQLHVKKAEFEPMQFLSGHYLDFFLPVSGKNCHSPFKKVERKPTLIISFSRQSPFFEGQ